MIIVRVNQGLGNQMFQYAFGECLGKYSGMNVMYDTSFIANRISGRNMRSINDIFIEKFDICDAKQLRKYTGRYSYRIPIIYNLIKKNETVFHVMNSLAWKFRKKKTAEVIQEPDYWNISNEFIDRIMKTELQTDRNYYFAGFWESIKYIEKDRDLLRSRFLFKICEDKVLRTSELIDESNSVSIHIRRGDYITKSNNDINFNLCGDVYYKDAIEKIKEKVANPTFFVFSDDIDAAKKIIGDDSNCVFVEGNKDYEDMYLMTRCKHNILANSTFSFWGAFLNSNSEQIVVAPKVQYLKNIDGVWKPVFLPVLSDWIVLQNEV